MQDWIALDGVRSDTIPGLAVMDYTDLYVAARSRETTAIAGRLKAIRQKGWKREPQDVTATLALVGDSEDAVVQLWREHVRPWLYGASRLTLSHAPELCYLGDVTGAVLSADEGFWITLTLTFSCNPALPVRLLTEAAGWWPVSATPIPKQITAQNASASGSFSGDGFLSVPGYNGMEPGACFFAVTGTWTTLKLGTDFEVTKAAETETTLFIDGENAMVWASKDGTDVNWMPVCTGDMPALSTAQKTLLVGGTGLNVTVLLLVMQYG